MREQFKRKGKLMAVIFKCDGCGVEVEQASAFKPHLWFSRKDEDCEQFACSRPCIDKIAEATGKTRVIIPI